MNKLYFFHKATFLALISFLLLTANTTTAEINPENPPISIKQPSLLDFDLDEPILGRIVGGTTASITDFPWQVAIMTSSNAQFCGGTVISEYWILTAAHCLGSYSNIKIRAGVTNKTHTTGQDRVVAQEIKHPQYVASTHRNDIALLRLSTPLDLSGANVKAIPIVTAAHASAGIQDPGVIATITGWGATSEGGSASNTLLKASVPIVSNAQAMSPGYYTTGQVTDDMICAGNLTQGGVDACQGDSGGPFVVPAADSPVGYRLAGATSWGIGCARPYYPGIYARVSYFQTWIQTTTGLTWEGPSGGVANPTNVTATGASQSQINLAWTKNAANNSVMVAWSPSGTFGTPANGTTYSAGQALSGGGTILYRGTATSFQHTGLSAATTYNYKVWSYNATNQYSSGATTSAATQCGTITALPYNEGFSGTTTPSCWSVIDRQGNGQVWKFGTVASGLSGASGNYAYLNSDGYGSGNTQNSDLVSPTYNFTGYSTVTLTFKHYFRQYNTVSTATLSYSLDNGSTWTQIQQWTASTANPATFTQQVPAVANKNNVKFRWNYTGSWGYYWCIDDVQITGTQQTTQYTLTMAVNGTGSVSPVPGTHTYNQGSTVNISASPSPGFVFDKWIVNGSNYTTASLQITMNANTTATAYFFQDTPTCNAYTLPFNEGFGTTSLPTCWSIVDHRNNGQVWKFGTVSNGLTGSSGNYAHLNSDGYGSGNTQNSDLVTPTLNLSSYGTVTLSFKHYFRQYQTSSTATLSYSINNGSTWTQVQQWTATTANPATFSMQIPNVAGQSQVKFKWNFTGTWGYYWCIDDVQITGSSAVQQYTLTMATNGTGTTTPAVGNHTYNSGSVVNLSATPGSGQQFVKWVVNGADNTNQSINVTMNSNVTATAHFTPIQYTLTTAVSGSGTTTPAVGTNTHNSGTVVNLNATPASGHQFVKWVITGQSDVLTASTTVTMNANKTATAHFAPIQYTLTMAVSGNGTTTPAVGNHTYNAGSVVNINATPGSGQQFVKWVVNGTDYTSQSLNLTMNANATATAHFAAQGCPAYTLPFNEGFANTTLPTCWSIIDNQGNGQVWQFGTGGSMSGASGNYAFLNSDGYGSGNSQNADLITPTLNLSAYTTVNVSFKHYYRHYTGSTARFFYSTNNGSTWTQVQAWTVDTGNPATFNMSIPAVAGQSQVKFKWNYTGTWGYYWSIDDVSITGTSCTVSSFPYTQNFSQSWVPDCWSLASQATNTWTRSTGYTIGSATVSPKSGTHFAYVPWQAVNQDEQLTTATFNFSSLSNPNLSFWFSGSYYWSVSPSNNCTLTVRASVNNGAWTQIWTSDNHPGFSTATAYDWLQANVSLSAYAGQSNLRLQFRYTGNDGAHFAIDDVVVSVGAKAGESNDLISLIERPLISVYPNPATNNVSITLRGLENETMIQLVNVQGQVVKTLTVGEAELLQTQEINLSEITPGLYLVRILSGDFSEVQRLVVK
ncbi:MAG: trypsin-like serine protease [Bacteroidetes bacterium]|nr:trypsin-like serine protease [Bacteroidota bacterium]